MKLMIGTMNSSVQYLLWELNQVRSAAIFSYASIQPVSKRLSERLESLDWKGEYMVCITTERERRLWRIRLIGGG